MMKRPTIFRIEECKGEKTMVKQILRILGRPGRFEIRGLGQKRCW